MVRVLTLNAHKGFSWMNRRFVLPGIRQALRMTSADVVFLQEVVGENAVKAARHGEWPPVPHYEFLAESVWPEYAYGRNVVYSHGHHGNAILSRYPIRHAERVDISTNRVERRGLLYCAIDWPLSDTVLHCVCVHLGLFARSRRKQLDMVAEYAADRVPADEPLVIAGDFNEWIARRGKAFVADLGLTDAIVATRGRMARTYPSLLPVLPLDRIYCRSLRVLGSDVLRNRAWSALSDHAGVTADVTAHALPVPVPAA